MARGMATDQCAFPDIGVPLYDAVGPQLDRCVVYSIVRTESGFDQHDKSPAKAVGLMQVAPEAGRDTAQSFDRRRSRDVLPKIKSNGRRVSVHWFAGVLQSLCSPS
jgi:soluble lytic murein transglycosylase-like protein